LSGKPLTAGFHSIRRLKNAEPSDSVYPHLFLDAFMPHANLRGLSQRFSVASELNGPQNRGRIWLFGF